MGAPVAFTVSPPSSVTSKVWSASERPERNRSSPAPMAQQHPDRFSALRSQIRQIARDQLPRDVRHIGIGPEMRAFSHGVMGKDQRFAAKLQDCAVIFKPARALVQGQAAQSCDEIRLVYDRTSFETASRMPFTNFASRSSKKAFATSTYSLIAAAVGTSARAISSYVPARRI